MSIRTIIRYPEPRFALVAQPVDVFDDALRELAADLLDTMRDAPGIGITAPHIGVALRVVVLELDATGAQTYVNPEIIWTSPETITHPEGSVSMPGARDDVVRHARVRIRFCDLDGNMFDLSVHGFDQIETRADREAQKTPARKKEPVPAE